MEDKPNESTLAHDEQVENTEFVDADAFLSDTWGTISDPTFDIAATPEVPLEGWFKRPRVIKNYTWTGAISESFDPWDLFFSLPDVAEKTHYYHMWQGNLKLRFVVNGNPFLYGRAVVGYIPLYSVNDAALRAMVNYPDNTAPRYSYLSQSLCDYIDPATTEVFELELPFLHPKNWARFNNETTTVAGGDVSNMGRIFLDSIVNLRNASTGTSDTITVTVFAYMDNLRMAVPTATASWILEGKKRKVKKSVNMQTGEVKEAAEKKLVVSSVASSVAEAAGYLTQVPMIGPFAMATQIGATAVSSIAKIFGFSSPLQLADEMPVSIKPYSNMAFTTVANTATKISVDPLNEVTIDPRVTGGCSDDDLVIRTISSREGYLTSIPWSASITPVSNRSTLCRIGVTPSITSNHHNVVQRCHQPLPCQFASYPFKYWRGTMKYRFEVVASQYHRGKVIIFYEPNLDSQTVLDATINLDYAKHKNIVVDLEELNGMELVVPWGTSRTYAEVSPISNGPYNYFPAYDSDPAVLITATPQQLNGFIELRVVNQLTSVADPATDITINVYASCEDLHVARPTGRDRNYRGAPAVVPASWILEGDVSKITAKSETVKHAILPEMSPDDLSKIVFGEEIYSFRNLLKRYTQVYNVDHSSFASVGATYLTAYPVLNGWSNTTIINTNIAATASINLFNYLAPAYVGFRGGYRQIYDYPTSPAKVTTVSISNVLGTTNSTFNSGFTNLADGGHVFKRATNSQVSASIPYYSPNRFYPGGNDTLLFNAGYTHTAIADGLYAVSNTLPSIAYISDIEGTDAGNIVRVYMAAADDFSFVHFVAAPPCFSAA